MRRWLVILSLMALSCRYRGLPEEIFIYPIQQGDIWYYEENVGDTLSVVDSVVVLRDTVYTYEGNKVPAWRVQKSHESASQGLIIDTNTTFIYKNAIMEVLPVEGLFPDSILYSGQWVKFVYNDDSVIVVWLPLRVKAGDKWVMARGSGRVIYGSLDCPMSITIDAEAVGYEDVVYKPLNKRFKGDTALYKGDSLVFEKALKVEYKVKTNMCAIPLEVVLLTIWWKSGIGPVKNDALGYPNNLITHLIGWKRP
ncbi:MAG: hypothetical protein ABIL16_08045 [candidate division WOR-3 bacterium]